VFPKDLEPVNVKIKKTKENSVKWQPIALDESRGTHETSYATNTPRTIAQIILVQSQYQAE
jgi:hypothetical protein